MSALDSYLDRVFVVDDTDARLRDPNDLSVFLPGATAGSFRLIPDGTRVVVSQVAIAPTGSQSKTVFALCAPAAGGAPFGWTSSRNFAGEFRNVTLGRIDPVTGAGHFSATAAWQDGAFIAQVVLAPIVDVKLEIEYITEATAPKFLEMADAAAGDGVAVVINSGFRTYAEQKFLRDGFVRGLHGFNPAAPPGFSNHQNGIALDIATGGGPGSPIYDWLAKHATSFGFVRTVSGEPWHWELRPAAAAAARAAGKHTI